MNGDNMQNRADMAGRPAGHISDERWASIAAELAACRRMFSAATVDLAAARRALKRAEVQDV